MNDVYYIGIDAGTTVMKSVLFDAAAHEVGVAQVNVPIEAPHPAWQEQDMDFVWNAAKETIREVLQRTGIAPWRVRAIGLTGNGGGCWLIDAQGKPVRKAISWLDGRAADIIADWERRGIAAEVYKLCGSIQYSGLQSAILKWLAIHEPETLRAAHATLWCKDWIKFKLTGVIGTDSSDCGISFLNIQTEQYEPKLLELMGLSEYARLLPKVYPVYEPTGTLLPGVADELGLSRDVVVVGGPFDMMASSIGVGAVSNGDAVSILGTALISQVVLDQPAIEPLNVGFTIWEGVPQRWIRAMAGMLGTPNLDWFLAHFCYEDKVNAERAGQDLYAYLEDKMRALPVGSGGILYHPYLSPSGERSPFINQNAKANFFGLSQEHTRHHVLRALYEGVALAIKHAYDCIPGAITRVNLSGGGAKSAFWCQMIADALGVPVRVPRGTEFGAKGAALNAMVALGLFKNHKEAVDALVKYEREYAPQVEHRARYDELYRIYRQLIEGLWTPWELVARFKQG